MGMPPWYATLALVWALSGFILDFARRRLPNTLNAVGLALAVAGVAAHGGGWPAPAAQALAGGVAGLFALLPFWWFRLMGAGDVKFFAVMGLLAGVWVLPPVFLVGSLLAGVVALAFVLARAGYLAGVVPLPAVLWLTAQARRGLPFGAALALGFCLSLLGGLDQPERLMRLVGS